MTARIEDWFKNNARRLPWRLDYSPYRIWIAEMMLQQTQVKKVIPFFERFMEHFPSLNDLAGASGQEVLLRWAGLGYYSRARNLHRAAQIIKREYSGQFPSDVSLLMQLPGIGRYTAGAIATLRYRIMNRSVNAYFVRAELENGFRLPTPYVARRWVTLEQVLEHPLPAPVSRFLNSFLGREMSNKKQD